MQHNRSCEQEPVWKADPWGHDVPGSDPILVVAGRGVRYAGCMLGQDFHVVFRHLAEAAGAEQTQLYRNLCRRLLPGWQLWRENFRDGNGHSCVDCLTFAGARTFLDSLAVHNLPEAARNRLDLVRRCFAGDMPTGTLYPVPPGMSYDLASRAIPNSPLRAFCAARFVVPFINRERSLWLPLRLACRWYNLDYATLCRFLDGHRRDFGERLRRVQDLDRAPQIYVPMRLVPDCLQTVATVLRGAGNLSWKRALLLAQAVHQHLLEHGADRPDPGPGAGTRRPAGRSADRAAARTGRQAGQAERPRRQQGRSAAGSPAGPSDRRSERSADRLPGRAVASGQEACADGEQDGQERPAGDFVARPETTRGCPDRSRAAPATPGPDDVVRDAGQAPAATCRPEALGKAARAAPASLSASSPQDRESGPEAGETVRESAQERTRQTVQEAGQEGARQKTRGPETEPCPLFPVPVGEEPDDLSSLRDEIGRIGERIEDLRKTMGFLQGAMQALHRRVVLLEMERATAPGSLYNQGIALGPAREGRILAEGGVRSALPSARTDEGPSCLPSPGRR